METTTTKAPRRPRLTLRMSMLLVLGLALWARVAPVLAERCPLDDARLLLDVAGGTGIYSIAWLLRHPDPDVRWPGLLS